MTEIYAGADWYVSRPEQEELWQGVLRERNVPLGPATRAALGYVLVTQDRELGVYAANVERQLASFVGQRVLVHGKLVDLSDEGFGQELWIASIQVGGSK
jgi:hypothetical protein